MYGTVSEPFGFSKKNTPSGNARLPSHGIPKVPTLVTTMHPGLFFSGGKKNNNSKILKEPTKAARSQTRFPVQRDFFDLAIESSNLRAPFLVLFFSLGEIRRRVRSRRRHDSYEAKKLRGLSGTAVMSLEDQTAKKPHTHGGANVDIYRGVHFPHANLFVLETPQLPSTRAEAPQNALN